ncbi:hypothetical protein L596_002673 [Steinernema carpocapsae]|uniref:PI3K/PI4K catalytic domain-containing protein n=1 Tax=Steinernema carpocapsae TaxID=34508 RepID=A0A4U8URR3_STECR|nr:hypothetical protein L596_002673 [Steinernema carpocapsae]
MFMRDPKNTATSEQVARFMMYVVVPSFAYAFERYDADEVVGSKPNPDEFDDKNLVSVLVTKIIDVSRQDMSDQMLIVIYQFCILLVQHCPSHIHEISQKLKQICHLRILMVFAWPCLQAQGPQDITVKYTGHLLIAHIIDKFAINRKIVLQVHSGLMKACSQDNRDIIRRALDVITVALPKRMDDGYLQLLLFMKKIISEEGHNVQQMTHCIGTVVRHYKVYYYVRHQMLPFLVNAVQRIVTHHSSPEAKKLIIDVCETIIKWELLRVKLVEKNVPTDEMDIDQLLKETARVSVTSDRETCSRARPYSPPHGSSTSSVPTTSSLTAGGNEEVHRCIDKHYANQALNTLIRMAISTAEQMAMHNQQNSTTPVAAATDALNKRCLMLLKAALKPSVWGFSASLSHLTYEKQLTACDTPNPTTQQIVQTQVSVEVLSSLIIIIPRNMILEHIGPLQRALCSCVTSNQAAVLRAMYTLLQRLLERSKCTKNGLEEFDTLNQALVRFINDSFNLFERSTPSVLQTIVAPLHILRLMSSENEEFLEAMCMASFTKMINKLVKDHADSMCPKTSSSSSTNRGEPRDFLTTETCYVAIDLLSSQIGRMNNVARKAVCQDVLSVLIERGVCDKLMTVIIKITEEFLKMQDETAVTQGIPLLCRMLKYQEERILGNREILQSFLYSVAHVFETPHLRCADITDRLDPAFYWGVCCNDENLRGRFMAVWDEKISPYLYQRIYYFLTEQDWKPLESQTWVMHCINLCMFSLNGVKRGPPDAKTSSKIKRRYNTALRSRMGNTCTYYDTFAYAVGKDLTTLAEEVPMEDTDYSMVLPENQRYALKLSPTLTNVMEDYETVVVHFMKLRDETGTCVFPEHREEPEVVERPATGAVAKGVDRVFEEFFHLFTVSSFFRFEDLAPDFIELCYSDSELACSVWTKMFTTFWSSLDDEERAKLVPKIITFLGSGQHSGQKDHDMSIIRCFLDAFIQCSPQIPIPLSLISYLASTHNNWHRALLHFEEEMQKLGKTFLRNVHTSPAETTISDQLDLYDALRLMYQKLNEQDQIEMIWERRAFFEETARLLQLRNLGDFAQVKEFTQDVIQRWTEPANAETNAQIQFGSYPLDVRHEVRLWTDIWIDSMRSLGEWGNVFDFANREHAFNSHLLVESCVQLSEWEALKDVIEVYGASIPEDDLPLYYIYNAMTKITQENFDENARNEVDQMEKDASISLITTWRSLPSVVSHSHMGLLRQAQLLQEIHEGAHITRNLACIAMDRKTTDIRDRPIDVTQYAAEIKAVVKTWRNRQLSLMDDFAASTEITNWRLYHFTKIEMEAQLRTAEENKRKELEKDQADKMDTSEAPATELPRPLQTGETVSFMGNIRPATNVLPRMQLFSQALEDMLSLNLNTFSQTVLGLAKIYRQSNHYGMALHQIKSLDVAPQVVRSDACAKTCDLLKTLMKLGHTKSQVINSLSTYFVGKGDRHKYLLEAMECTQHITHDQFTADENSRMLSLRGGVFSKLDADLEAGKAFVIAGKMYNVSGSFTCNYVYKCWGEHLEKLYERSGGVDESSGVQALYCFCSCARVEARSRKYIAKMLWILKQLSNSKSSDILARIQVTFKKLAECVPSANWVIWLNELFHHVKQRNGVLTMPLLCHIAKNNPEPILYAIRKHLQDDLLERQIRNVCRDVEIKFPLVVDIKGDYQEPRRPEDYFDFSKMTKCSQYLMSVLELAVRSRPSDLLNLNIVLSSLESLSRGWYERQMTKLRVLKEQCCKELFDQLQTITTARPSEELCDLVAKWSISAKDLAYRSHCEDYDAVKFVSERFGELAKEVKTGTTLFKLFNKVVEYLELVEQRTKLVTRDGLIRGETAFLTQFSTKIAYIDIFGCVMTTKQQQAQYTEKIARFLPRYTSTYQNGKVYRLVSVLSECGKVYTYAVERRSAKDGLDQNNKESVYRMFGLLNSYIAKDHECSRRLLLFNQPSVLPIGLDMSLVEYAPFGPTYPQPSGNTRFMRYTDIFTESLMEYNIEEHPDRILTKFYNSVVEHMENEGEPDEEFLEKVYMRVAENTEVGKALVPADMMTKWMRRCYANATHEWITRKQTACYLGMYFLSEYMFHLSAMGLDFMVLNIFTGQTVAMEYKFDIHFEAHKGNVNLVNEKVVPFRLSPNLYHFLGASMDGHMKNAMIALARCFESHDAVVMARPLLYDLYHDLLVRSSFDESDAINAVKKSSDAIAERIHGAATLESGKNTVAYMIYEASKKENLSKISPSFHPWF